LPYNIKATYNKGNRNIKSAPGKSYWQNKVGYNINVVFDPVSGKGIKKVQLGNTYIPDRYKSDNV